MFPYFSKLDDIAIPMPNVLFDTLLVERNFYTISDEAIWWPSFNGVRRSSRSLQHQRIFCWGSL